MGIFRNVIAFLPRHQEKKRKHPYNSDMLPGGYTTRGLCYPLCVLNSATFPNSPTLVVDYESLHSLSSYRYFENVEHFSIPPCMTRRCLMRNGEPNLFLKASRKLNHDKPEQTSAFRGRNVRYGIEHHCHQAEGRVAKGHNPASRPCHYRARRRPCPGNRE